MFVGACLCFWGNRSCSFGKLIKNNNSLVVCAACYFRQNLLCPGKGCLGVLWNLRPQSPLSAWLQFKSPRVTAVPLRCWLTPTVHSCDIFWHEHMYCDFFVWVSKEYIVTSEKNLVRRLSPQCLLISKFFYSWRKQLYTLRVKFNCCIINFQWNSAFLFGK